LALEAPDLGKDRGRTPLRARPRERQGPDPATRPTPGKTGAGRRYAPDLGKERPDAVDNAADLGAGEGPTGPLSGWVQCGLDQVSRPGSAGEIPAWRDKSAVAVAIFGVTHA
jgi:hypothetical protein